MKKIILVGVGLIALVGAGIAGYSVLKPNEFNSLTKLSIDSQEDVYFDATKISKDEKSLFAKAQGKYTPVIFENKDEVKIKIALLDPKTNNFANHKDLEDKILGFIDVEPYQPNVAYYDNDEGMDICAIYVDTSKYELDQSIQHDTMIALCELSEQKIIGNMVSISEIEQNAIDKKAEKYKMDRTAPKLIDLTLNKYWTSLYTDVYAIQNHFNKHGAESASTAIDKLISYKVANATNAADSSASNTYTALKLLGKMQSSGEISPDDSARDVFSVLVEKRNEYLPPLDDFFVYLLQGFEQVNDNNFARDWILEKESIKAYMKKIPYLEPLALPTDIK